MNNAELQYNVLQDQNVGVEGRDLKVGWTGINRAILLAYECGICINWWNILLYQSVVSNPSEISTPIGIWFKPLIPGIKVYALNTDRYELHLFICILKEAQGTVQSFARITKWYKRSYSGRVLGKGYRVLYKRCCLSHKITQ